MRKLLLVLLVLGLVAAYFTRPSDKECIIGGVKAVWGDLMPDVDEAPSYFEQFMNINSVNVQVKDWVFLKQIKYKLQGQYKTVAYGAFENVFPVIKPVEMNENIPAMPKR